MVFAQTLAGRISSDWDTGDGASKNFGIRMSRAGGLEAGWMEGVPDQWSG
jgi:hypothetical protein